MGANFLFALKTTNCVFVDFRSILAEFVIFEGYLIRISLHLFQADRFDLGFWERRVVDRVIVLNKFVLLLLVSVTVSPAVAPDLEKPGGCL